jgi:hypothetical protein
MSWQSYWPHSAGAESVCRVARLRWFLQLVGDILQILADRRTSALTLRRKTT